VKQVIVSSVPRVPCTHKNLKKNKIIVKRCAKSFQEKQNPDTPMSLESAVLIERTVQNITEGFLASIATDYSHRNILRDDMWPKPMRKGTVLCGIFSQSHL